MIENCLYRRLRIPLAYEPYTAGHRETTPRREYQRLKRPNLLKVLFTLQRKPSPPPQSERAAHQEGWKGIEETKWRPLAHSAQRGVYTPPPFAFSRLPFSPFGSRSAPPFARASAPLDGCSRRLIERTLGTSELTDKAKARPPACCAAAPCLSWWRGWRSAWTLRTSRGHHTSPAPAAPPLSRASSTTTAPPSGPLFPGGTPRSSTGGPWWRPPAAQKRDSTTGSFPAAWLGCSPRSWANSSSSTPERLPWSAPRPPPSTTTAAMLVAQPAAWQMRTPPERSRGDEQEADQVMMYLPKRRVVHSTAGKLQEPLFAEMNPSAYGIRKRVAPFKRRLHVQVARQDEKRSTRRQLKDAAASPFRRKTHKKAFGKKAASSAFFLSGHQGKASPVPVVVGNATVHKSDAKTSSAAQGSGGNKKYHIMKRSSYSTDEKVTGELRNIFEEDDDDRKKREKKTLKKRENAVTALKGPSGVDDSSSAVPAGSDAAATASKGTSTDEDKFKKWLLDEYYRTMALSFASMRRKRMATHQDTLDLRQVKRTALAPSTPVAGTADDQFQVVEDKLRSIEDTMIGEAVALVRDGASDEAELRAINAGVASRLDAAYDLESVRQSLDHLQSTLEDMRRQELQAALAEDEDEGDSAAVLRNDGADVQELAPQGSSWAQLTDKRKMRSPLNTDAEC
ncbi:hypothetical protein MTO96_024890 [Rhipicephalus appendiculatus]